VTEKKSPQLTERKRQKKQKGQNSPKSVKSHFFNSYLDFYNQTGSLVLSQILSMTR